VASARVPAFDRRVLAFMFLLIDRPENEKKLVVKQHPGAIRTHSVLALSTRKDTPAILGLSI